MRARNSGSHRSAPDFLAHTGASQIFVRWHRRDSDLLGCAGVTQKFSWQLSFCRHSPAERCRWLFPYGPQFLFREHDALCSYGADTPQNALLLCFVVTVLKRMGADQMAGPRQLGHVSAGGHVAKAQRFKKSAPIACKYLQTPSKNARSTLNPFVCSSTRTLQRGR